MREGRTKVNFCLIWNEKKNAVLVIYHIYNVCCAY